MNIKVGDIVNWKRSAATTHLTTFKVVNSQLKNGLLVVYGLEGRFFDPLTGNEVGKKKSLITKVSDEYAAEQLIRSKDAKFDFDKIVEKLTTDSLKFKQI